MRDKTALTVCVLACVVPGPSGCTGNVGDGGYDTTGASSTAGMGADDVPITTGPSGVGDGGSGTPVAAGNGSVPGSGDAAGGHGPNGPNAATAACGDGIEALATGLRISQVALYQTIKIPLYDAGVWVQSRITQVVQGKAALLRVFVEPLPSWSSRAVRAVLTLDNGGSPTQLTVQLAPASASSDARLSSTFNFEIDGADLGPTTKLSVSIVDTDCPAVLGDSADVRVPVSGMQPLGAQRVGTLKLVIVPVELPSSPMPDTSRRHLEAMRQALLAYYPLADVDISVHAPYSWPTGIRPDGGWAELLNALGSLRDSDRPGDDVYYYGLVTPANTLEQYCGYGCTLGIANQGSRVFAQAQVGLGAGWIDERTYETLVHEIAHTHGLGHAPCVEGGRIGGVDRNFPYEGGVTGTWGWDLRDGGLHPPTDLDIMGYCSPTWISDYNYQALLSRSRQVNERPTRRLGHVPRTWRSLIIYGDGSARWGVSTTGSMAGAPTEAARVLDGSGAELTQVEVVRVQLSDSAQQFLYLPTPAPGWATLQLEDQALRFSDIAPSLAR